MIHAPGLAGIPSRCQVVTAASNASCTASSASWKSPDLPDQGGQDDRPFLAERARDGIVHPRLLTSSSANSTPARRAVFNHSSGGMIGRTSIVPQRVIGIRAACLSASSRSAHSST